MFTDWASFSAAFWASRGCYCIVDEAPDVFEQDRDGARMMMRRGRHNGHVVALIAVRLTTLDKTAREQCTQVFAFNVGVDDAEMLAKEWNEPAFLELPSLAPLHYIEKTRHQPARRGVLRF